MVYVLNKNGKPLMPTERHGRVRRLLKGGKAKVVSHKPFTIMLLYDTPDIVQHAKLRVDTGSSHIGVSDEKKLPSVMRADEQVSYAK